jgi:hypothetical protein
MQQPDSDRRKYPRLETDQMIAVARVDTGAQIAQSRDVSLGGIRFQIFGAELELGDVLRIYFNVEDQTVSGLGRVVWATDLDAFTTDVGLEFLEIDPVAFQFLEKLAAA